VMGVAIEPSQSDHGGNYMRAEKFQQGNRR